MSASIPKPPISRYPVPELKDLAPDLRERIEQVQEKAGFVPNVFLALAHLVERRTRRLQPAPIAVDR